MLIKYRSVAEKMIIIHAMHLFTWYRHIVLKVRKFEWQKWHYISISIAKCFKTSYFPPALKFRGWIIFVFPPYRAQWMDICRAGGWRGMRVATFTQLQFTWYRQPSNWPSCRLHFSTRKPGIANRNKHYWDHKWIIQ